MMALSRGKSLRIATETSAVVFCAGGSVWRRRLMNLPDQPIPFAVILSKIPVTGAEDAPLFSPLPFEREACPPLAWAGEGVQAFEVNPVHPVNHV
jgi:hypothetical protein